MKDDADPPVLDPLSDAGQLTMLLEWGRKRGFRIGPIVRLGSIQLQVQDLRQTEGRGIEPPADPGAWTAAGYPEGDE